MERLMVSKTPNEIQYILKQLREKFPVFAQFRPLRIGIHREIHRQLPMLSQRLICKAIRIHVQDMRYLKSIAVGGNRFDLDLSPNGVVPTQHQQRARDMLSRQKKPTKQVSKQDQEPRKKLIARVVRVIREPVI